LFKTETHLHTRESNICADLDVEKTLKLHQGAGYSTIIMTNHYSSENLDRPEFPTWGDKIDYLMKSYKIAKHIESEYGINVLFAIELTLKQTGSDYLIYGITEDFLRNNLDLYDLSLGELVKLCEENGFLIVQAHPFRERIELAPLEYKVPIESYNGHTYLDPKNDVATAYAKENNLIGVSGSDFHREEKLARGGIVTENEIKTIQEFIDVIKSRKFKTIEGGEVVQ